MQILAWKNHIINRLTEYSEKHPSAIQHSWRDLSSHSDPNIHETKKRKKTPKKKDSASDFSSKCKYDASKLMDLKSKRWQSIKCGEAATEWSVMYDEMVLADEEDSAFATLPEKIIVTNEVEVSSEETSAGQEIVSEPEIVIEVEEDEDDILTEEDVNMDHLYCAGDAKKEHAYERPSVIEDQFQEALQFLNPFTMEQGLLFQCMHNIDKELCMLTCNANPSILRNKDAASLLDKELMQKIIIEMQQRAPFTFALLSVLLCPKHINDPDKHKITACMYGVGIYCRNNAYSAVQRLLSMCVPFRPAFKEIFDVFNSLALTLPYTSLDKIRCSYGETSCDLIRQQMVRCRKSRKWIQHVP